MWLSLAFVSAALLGLYDVAKKMALARNAVIPVLLLNVLFSTLIFLPVIIASAGGFGWFDGTMLEAPAGNLHAHALVAVKAVLVLSSWVFGYYGIQNLPITIVGPINATRPVMVLVGAMLFFGERLNALQWTGVALAAASLFLLSRSGRREGVDFTHNRWIFCVAMAAALGAVCGLYDRYIMLQLAPGFVQSWFNFYQLLIMLVVAAVGWWPRRREQPIRWCWAIPAVSVLLSCADFAYFSALSNDEAMISIVSMVRRGSVIVSFLCGALLFREKNLRAKAFDLLLILIGMLFLYFGSK